MKARSHNRPSLSMDAYLGELNAIRQEYQNIKNLEINTGKVCFSSKGFTRYQLPELSRVHSWVLAFRQSEYFNVKCYNLYIVTNISMLSTTIDNRAEETTCVFL